MLFYKKTGLSSRALSRALKSVRNAARRSTDTSNYKCEIHYSRVRASARSPARPTVARLKDCQQTRYGSVECAGELLRAATIPKSRRSHEKSSWIVRRKRVLEESNREGAKGTSTRPRKLEREQFGRTSGSKSRTMFIQHHRYGDDTTAREET